MDEVRWIHLGRQARAFRVAHAAFSIVQLAALAYVWFCAATRRRDRALTISAAALLIEGAALVVGRGDCPFGPMQAKLGDPVPLFELVLPRRTLPRPPSRPCSSWPSAGWLACCCGLRWTEATEA